jgi:hypothetical protein
MAENRQGAKSLQEIAAEEGTDAFTRLDQIAAEAAYIHELSEKYEVPETAIRLVTQQLPTTPTAAAALGESTAEAAVAATKAAEPAPAAAPKFEKPTTTPKDRIALALRGPSALKLARSEAMVNKQERLAAMRKRLGNQNADAEMTRAVFSRLTGTKKEKPAPPVAPVVAPPPEPPRVELSAVKQELARKVAIDRKLTELCDNLKTRRARLDATIPVTK